MELIGIAAFLLALTGLVGLIILSRRVINSRWMRSADHYMEKGEFNKAARLYVKALKFNIGDDKVWPVLDSMTQLYRNAGCSEEEVAEIIQAYRTIHEYFTEQVRDIQKKKLKDQAEIRAMEELDDEIQVRFKQEFTAVLPPVQP